MQVLGECLHGGFYDDILHAGNAQILFGEAQDEGEIRRVRLDAERRLGELAKGEQLHQ